jgi:hypothetical protein
MGIKFCNFVGFCLGYNPDQVNMSQSQVLDMLAKTKSAGNMTATQSEQISQLASDTQVPSSIWLYL